MSKSIKELMAELKSFFNEEAAEGAPLAMGDAMLKDGTKIKWEGDLAEGTAILVESPDGDIAAPDATHELENGTLVTTVNGLVTEIVPVTPETASEEPTADLAELQSELTELRSLVTELSDSVQSFAKQLEAKDLKIENLKATFKKTVEMVELVANLPQEESTETPATPEKSRFDKDVERVKQLQKAINKTIK